MGKGGKRASPPPPSPLPGQLLSRRQPWRLLLPPRGPPVAAVACKGPSFLPPLPGPGGRGRGRGRHADGGAHGSALSSPPHARRLRAAAALDGGPDGLRGALSRASRLRGPHRGRRGLRAASLGHRLLGRRPERHRAAVPSVAAGAPVRGARLLRRAGGDDGARGRRRLARGAAARRAELRRRRHRADREGARGGGGHPERLRPGPEARPRRGSSSATSRRRAAGSTAGRRRKRRAVASRSTTPPRSRTATTISRTRPSPRWAAAPPASSRGTRRCPSCASGRCWPSSSRSCPRRRPASRRSRPWGRRRNLARSR